VSRSLMLVVCCLLLLLLLLFFGAWEGPLARWSASRSRARSFDRPPSRSVADTHLCEHVEQRGLAHVGQADDAHLLVCCGAATCDRVSRSREAGRAANCCSPLTFKLVLKRPRIGRSFGPSSFFLGAMLCPGYEYGCCLLLGRSAVGARARGKRERAA
jgi:hypothetical protein